MYTIINPINDIIDKASRYILTNDRMLYSDIFFITEEFCNEYGFAINSVDMLLQNPISKDSFMYDIFVVGDFHTIKELAQRLLSAKVPHLSINTLLIKTLIKDRELIIGINLRFIINIHIVQRIPDLFVKVPGFFSKEVPVLSPLIQLISTYQSLYNYNNYKKFQSLLDTEEKLYDLLDHTNIIGGFDKQKIIKQIVTNISEIGGICIGDLATSNTVYRAQFISDYSIDKIVSFIKTIIPKNITYSYSSFFFDFRLIKYTIKADNIDICDIFNSTTYEMIPTEMINGRLCATRFVNQRFMLIQYYIIKLVVKGNASLNNYKSYRDETQLLLNDDLSKLFDASLIMGNAIPEKISRRKIAEKFDPVPLYYPALSAKFGGGGALAPRIGQPVIIRNSPNFLKITHKITRDYRDDIFDILKTYYDTSSQLWSSQNIKNDTRYNFILRYVKQIKIYIDVGTGDGRDFELIADKVKAARPIASDIIDQRVNKTQDFILLGLNKPIPVSSVDLVTVFHSLHHAEDALYRLRDISRIIKDGGILIIKDHDIVTEDDAMNVSFEHFVYSIGEGTATIHDDARYQDIVPMYYYSAKQIREFVIGLGFTEVLFNEVLFNKTKTLTRVYYAIFKKNYSKKGSFSIKCFDNFNNYI